MQIPISPIMFTGNALPLQWTLKNKPILLQPTDLRQNYAMKQVFYVSQSVAGHTDVPAILASARRRNFSLNVTGSLLFTGGFFAQVLEGEEPSLDEVMAVIAADHRHRNIKTLLDRPLVRRQFSDWSMAFTELPGAEYLIEQLTDEENVSSARAEKLIALMFESCLKKAV